MTPTLTPTDQYAQAINGIQAQAAAFADHINSEKLAHFTEQYKVWKMAMDIHPELKHDPMPLPPLKVAVQQTADPFLPKIVETDIPVCATPVYVPLAYKASVPLFGEQDVMNVPPGDNWPLGVPRHSPDGTSWVKVSEPGPFGVSVYYQKVL